MTSIDQESQFKLVQAARLAKLKAYAPYSQYPVGAAVLTESGEIYTGCNIENASYPAGICAERVAMSTACAHGHRQFIAIAVVTNGTVDGPGAPCGICRQFMSEFSTDLSIITAKDGSVGLDSPSDFVGTTLSLSALLPYPFNKQDLKIHEG